MTALLASVSGSIDPDAALRIKEQLTEWDRKTPLVLTNGISLSTIGGLTFTIVLQQGPLDDVRFTVNVPTLNDLPPQFDYQGGAYVRSLPDGTYQLHTVDGHPVYAWRPA